MVSYRTAALAIEALKALAGEVVMAGMRIRTVVVDNASGDGPVIAKAIADQDWSAWVTLIVAPKNGGYAYGNNLGLEHAYRGGRPSYVYLLNPDTKVRPGAIVTLVRFLECHPDAGIAGSSFETCDGSEWPIAFRFPSLLSELDSGLQFSPVTRLLKPWVVARSMPRITQRVDWICGASMMIRPAVLDAIGGLDENYFLYFEETDFCYRARKAGFATWYVPESRVMHVGGASTSISGPNAGTQQRPPYWFHSRRRYFAMTFGVSHAAAIDAVAVLAYALGFLKRLALGRRRTAVSHYTRDLLWSSVLWPWNRHFPPVRGFVPPA
jgi:GT2 family glycosyltransferase